MFFLLPCWVFVYFLSVCKRFIVLRNFLLTFCVRVMKFSCENCELRQPFPSRRTESCSFGFSLSYVSRDGFIFDDDDYKATDLKHLSDLLRERRGPVVFVGPVCLSICCVGYQLGQLTRAADLFI